MQLSMKTNSGVDRGGAQVGQAPAKNLWILLPVTTASAERSFSTLKRLKTYLRSKTEEQ